MGYSRYVGRVGGLAVVLGVGLAFGSGHGMAVAHADGTGDGSTSSSAPGPTDGPAAKHPIHLAQVLQHLISGADTSTATTPLASNTDVPKSEGAHGVTTVKSKLATTNLLTPPRHLRSVPDDTTFSAVMRSSDPQSQTVGLATSLKQRIADATERLVPHEALPNIVNRVEQQPPSLKPAVTPSPSLIVAPTLRQEPVRLVAAVLSAFGIGPLAPPSPTQPPVQPTVGWALLGWVRREIEHTFFNKTPTLAPQQTSLVTDADGEIHGTLGANDPDGDTLTYTAGPAEHGTVSIDQSAGTWTYTPTDGYVGADSFTVTASDESSGFHLHGLAGLFEPDGGHTVTATVAVSVATPASVLGKVQLPGEPVGQPLFSPDGRYVYQVTKGALGDDDSVNLLVVDTQTGKFRSQRTFDGVDLVDGQGLIPTADGQHALMVVVHPGEGTTLGETDVYDLDLADPSTVPAPIHLKGRQQSAGDLVLSSDGIHAYLVTQGAAVQPSSEFPQATTEVADIDLATGHLAGSQAEIVGNPVGHLVQTANGRLLLTVLPDPPSGPALPATVAVIDSGTGQLVGAPVNIGDGDPFQNIAVSDDGTRALANILTATGARATLIDTDDATQVAIVGLGPFDTINFEGGGSVLNLVRDSPNGAEVTVIDAKTGEASDPIELVGAVGEVGEIGSDSDGTTWYRSSPATNQTVITSIDPTGHATAIPISGQYHGFAQNETGSLDYVTTYDDTSKTTAVTVIDDQTKTPVRTITVPGSPATVHGPTTLLVSSDKTHALQFTSVTGPGGSRTTQVTEIDLTTGNVVGTTSSVGVDSSAQADFTPDGSKATIVSEPLAGGDDTAYVLDVATGNVSRPVALEAAGLLTQSSVSADGQREFLYLQASGDPAASVAELDLSHPGLLAETSVQPGALVTDKAGTVAVVESSANAQGDAAATIIDSNGNIGGFTAVDAGAVYTTFSDDGSRVYIELVEPPPPGVFTPANTIVYVYGISDSRPTLISDNEVSFATLGPVILDPNGTRALVETSGFAGPGVIDVLDTGQAPTSESV